MSRPAKWLPFFEAVSEKRDTATWWSYIKSELVSKNFSIIGMVSDRAKALVKLSNPEYLDSFSMPDLFHFMQDISKTVGARLGSKVAKAQKYLSKTDCKSDNYELLQEDLIKKTAEQNKYKNLCAQINNSIHPFDKNDQLYQTNQLDTDLRHLFTKIKCIAQKNNIEIPLAQASKILNQIPDLVGGIQHWQNYLNTEIEKLELNAKEQTWLIKALLPFLYWQFHLSKICRKEKNKELNQNYQERLEYAQLRYQILSKDLKIEESEKQQLINWASKIVGTFHRSSSRVEGRNGYLAFMHHANKGIPERRKKVLTVIHNFDIKDKNQTTSAERLFDRKFPNLFEFILGDLGQLPSPRSRTMKTGIKT